MCGIAALFASNPAPLEPLVRAMTDTVRHRGPDDEGVVVFSAGMMTATASGGIDTPQAVYQMAVSYAPVRQSGSNPDVVAALGHRRLSILDVSAAGHQPMCTADGRFWVIHNGEIYNYLELRAELESLGHAFVSQTDTEVILAAYRAWGEECLQRFNGMFAFVLVDREARRVFAARDRFGVKPLYLWRSAQGLVALASEIKQFTLLPGWSPTVNGQRAYDFLNWGLIDHTDETIFEGVRQLRGGQSFHCSVKELLAGPPITQWYHLAPQPFDGDMKAAAEQFLSLFTDAVRLRLRSDVPVGSCLSGGLDSSSIVCVMNELLRRNTGATRQKTFSSCSKVDRFDERPYIDEVVRQTGADAHYVYPSLTELFETVDRVTWMQDEPFGSTSIYAQWHVFRLAAEHGVTVMLDGQGADEQLAGYHAYFAPYLGRFLREGRWTTLWRELRGLKTVHGYPMSWGVKQLLDNVLPESIRQRVRLLAGKAGSAASWLDMNRLGAAPQDPFAMAGAAKARTVQLMSRAQIGATSLPMLLHWEDRNSMAHSIEARVPFLDYRLVEFVLGLPDEYKIAEGVTKRVLREGLRTTLPERVRNRRDKLGFATPEEVWMREDNPDLFRRALHDAVKLSSGIIGSDAGSLFEKIVEGRRSFSFLVWRLISFGVWMRTFAVRA
ncbi:MAG: asparagine synthase (glutamine-hydrolyzing) [Nitrospira sp.]|nr:asparagine synthase (glutamine-hydrolyzing) [Nitrospira sp.]